MHLDNPREAGTTRLPAINGSEYPIPDRIPFDNVSQGWFLNYVKRRTAVNNNDELLILWLQDLNLLLTSS